MSKNLILAALLLCVTHIDGRSQDVCLGVGDVLTAIAADNADVRSARSNLSAVKEGIDIARSARLPQISASLDLNYLGDGTILDRDFSNAMRDKLPHFGNTLNVNLYQPVYQGGAISAGIDLSHLQYELASIGVEQQIDASGLEALSNFFNLVKMRNLRRVYVENIDITRRLIDQMNEHYAQGTALKNDITRYRLRLSSLSYDLQTVDNSISVLNNNLVTLLALAPGTNILPQISEREESPELADENYWQTLTAMGSKDLRALDTSGRIASSALKIERASMLPSVGIVLGDQLTGPITFEIPTIDKNYNAWFAGVSIRYNISSLYTSNRRVRQRRLEVEHIHDQRFAVAEALSRRVHEAYVGAVQARQMLDTETVNVELANENYRVVETRFANDMALLTDMLDASTAKLDAETRLVNARINLILSYFQLKYISGTLSQL